MYNLMKFVPIGFVLGVFSLSANASEEGSGRNWSQLHNWRQAGYEQMQRWDSQWAPWLVEIHMHLYDDNNLTRLGDVIPQLPLRTDIMHRWFLGGNSPLFLGYEWKVSHDTEKRTMLIHFYHTRSGWVTIKTGNGRKAKVLGEFRVREENRLHTVRAKMDLLTLEDSSPTIDDVLVALKRHSKNSDPNVYLKNDDYDTYDSLSGDSRLQINWKEQGILQNPILDKRVFVDHPQKE